MTYVILGSPRTKKTGQRILRFGKFNKIVPSAAFIEYQVNAVPQLEVQRHMLGAKPYDKPVHVKATFYRDANRGDWCGYTQALGDILEMAGVIANDRLIAHWDGTRLDKDAANPRVEVQIFEVAA